MWGTPIIRVLLNTILGLLFRYSRQMPSSSCGKKGILHWSTCTEQKLLGCLLVPWIVHEPEFRRIESRSPIICSSFKYKIFSAFAWLKKNVGYKTSIQRASNLIWAIIFVKNGINSLVRPFHLIRSSNEIFLIWSHISTIYGVSKFLAHVNDFPAFWLVP